MRLRGITTALVFGIFAGACAKKQELPITMSLRKALLGPGYVAIFKTTIKDSVPVLVTLDSAALGTRKKFELQLSAVGATELGHVEGAVIQDNDTITVENTKYTPAKFTVNGK